MEQLFKNEECLKSYIATPDKFDWYKKTFSKYEVNGVEKFEWSWSWWAFWGGFIYLLYRKCYLEAFILAVITIVIDSISPLSGLVFSIVTGGVLPYLVYKKYKNTISKIEQTETRFDKQIGMIKSLGGVNETLRNLGIGWTIIELLLALHM
ncbi:MAG: DUF2628 domain-containing protein [Cetobacterium sp.]